MSGRLKVLINEVTVCRIRLLFVGIGIIWVCLFPAICVSTGELKVRSTFFDETTLAPLAAKTDFLLPKNLTQPSELSSTCWYQQIYRPTSSVLESIVIIGLDGTSLMVARELYNYLSQMPWLAKNIIFVQAKSPACVKEWLDAYLGTANYPERAGIIRAGLVLSSHALITGRKLKKRILLRSHGANAASANLDYVHLALSAFRGIISVETCCLNKCLDVRGETYVERILGLIFWNCAAISGPSGSHALLLNRGIDAISLELPNLNGVLNENDDEIRQRISLGLELIIRSLNTIEHALHHSFFFYWLPSVRHFVSIDEFAWPLMVLIIGLYGLTGLSSLYHCLKTTNYLSIVSTLSVTVLPFLYCGIGLSSISYILMSTPAIIFLVYTSYVLVFLFFCYWKIWLFKAYDNNLAHAILLLAWGFLLAPLVLGHSSLAFLGLFMAAPWLLLKDSFASFFWLVVLLLWPAFPFHVVYEQYKLYADWKHTIIFRFAFAIHAAAGARLFIGAGTSNIVLRKSE
mmetsp:Transcript_16548/g.21557  ORF Transcript_16548/g.21557 Transcript_16548/m.21557 type:complete len:517 (+) Transcript_16548:407-1957(+)